MKKSSLENPTSKTSNQLVKGMIIVMVVVMGTYHVITTIGSLIINRVPKS